MVRTLGAARICAARPMRWQGPQAIMGKMSSQSNHPHHEGEIYSHHREGDVRRSSRGSTKIALTVCGDPVIGRALTLLLQGSEYDIKFLPIWSKDEMVLPDDTQLLLLTPDLSVGDRESLSKMLGDRAGGKQIPVLELIAASGTQQNEEAQHHPEHLAPWPCSTESLKRRIQAALFGDPEKDNRG